MSADNFLSFVQGCVQSVRQWVSSGPQKKWLGIRGSWSVRCFAAHMPPRPVSLRRSPKCTEHCRAERHCAEGHQLHMCSCVHGTLRQHRLSSQVLPEAQHRSAEDLARLCRAVCSPSTQRVPAQQGVCAWVFLGRLVLCSTTGHPDQ